MLDKIAWYEDPKFWDWTHDFLFTPERWESAANLIDDLIALTQIQPESSILDLCCGPGRFSIPLAARQYRVTAVDRSPKSLDELRRRSRDQGLSIEVIEEDMRTYRKPESFDIVLNLFTSFGYFDDPDEDRQVLQNVHDSLKAGGRFLIDVVSRDWVVANYQKRDWSEHNGRYLLEEHEFIEDTARMRTRWIILDKERQREFYYTLRLHNAPELMKLLNAAGFSKLSLMSNYKKEPFDFRSSRLIILAQK